MTLSWQISIIEEMIRENRDVRIKDYFLLLAEVEQIENKTEDMGSRKGKPNLPEEKRQQILALAKQKIAANRIAKKCLVSLNQVYKVCAKDAGSIMALRHPEVLRPKEPEDISAIEPPSLRPRAEYSNSGSISVTQKYAI